MAPLEIRTFPGAGGGMDQSSPVHMLPDSKARWIVDAFVDRPGLVRQRGKIKGTQISAKSPYGLMHTYQPDGTLVLAAHVSDDSTGNEFQFLSNNNGTLGTTQYTANFGVGGPPVFWDAKPLLKGPGQCFGFTQSINYSVLQRFLGFWRGGTKADYTTGSITATASSNSVTGSGTTWSSNVTPGMFLLADNGGSTYTFLGVVKQVNSNTVLTLESFSLATVGPGKAYKLTSIRGLSPRTVVGRISGATGQTIINGTGTKFNQMSGGGTWMLYRQRDMQQIGTITSIQSDTQLTLTANALVATSNDKYVGVLISDSFAINPSSGLPVGFLNAVWKGRQFYANGIASNNAPEAQCRVWYSDTEDYEALDLTQDGYNLDVTSTEGGSRPILGLCSTPSALLIFKETEVFALTGTVDPNSWSVDKISDNGTLCHMSIQAYGQGAIWASDRGIFQYDGATVTNLTEDAIGDLWTKAMQSYSPTNAGIFSMIERDHYFVHIEGFWAFPSGTGYFKGATEFNPTDLTWCLNLQTGAITMLRNVGIRAATTISATGTQEATTRFLVEKGSDASSWICKAITLFTDEGTSAVTGGVDDFACAGGNSGGPDFYVESARYDMDDPQIRKLWKQLQMFYSVLTQPLTVEVVQDFANSGTVLGSTFAAQSAMTNKRMKFLKRSNLLGFRIYSQTGAPGSGTPSTEVILGPWAIGFKRQRPGRI